MRNYVIVTDSCIDMTQEMVDSLGIKVAQLDIVIEGENSVLKNSYWLSLKSDDASADVSPSNPFSSKINKYRSIVFESSYKLKN